MFRVFALMVIVVVSSRCVTADESRAARKLPHGSWQLKHDNGATVSLTVTEKSATWIGAFPDGTMTIKVPGFQLSEEGVVYGYAKEHTWATSNQTQTVTTIIPFAFSAKVTDDSLTVNDLRIFGLTEKTVQAMMGTYRKQSSPIAAKTANPAASTVTR